MVNQVQRQNSLYGFPSPLSNAFPDPIVSPVAPSTLDQGIIGQLWIQPTDVTGAAVNGAWILTSILGGVFNWLQVEAGGGAGVFSSLVVTPGPVTFTSTFSQTGPSTFTGATAVVGSFTQSGGNVSMSNDATNSVALFNTGAGNKTTGIGSATGTSTTNILAGSGGVVFNSPFLALPGPVYVYTGAGTPSNALALHVGDLYVNTTPTGATDRMFIATGVGAWTNFTTAA